nr:unnamed protein product [Digitaria exilis]
MVGSFVQAAHVQLQIPETHPNPAEPNANPDPAPSTIDQRRSQSKQHPPPSDDARAAPAAGSGPELVRRRGEALLPRRRLGRRAEALPVQLPRCSPFKLPHSHHHHRTGRSCGDAGERDHDSRGGRINAGKAEWSWGAAGPTDSERELGGMVAGLRPAGELVWCGGSGRGEREEDEGARWGGTHLGAQPLAVSSLRPESLHGGPRSLRGPVVSGGGRRVTTTCEAEQPPPPPPVHHRLVPLPPPPARHRRPEGEIGWIWSLHGGSDEGDGGNVNNFMTTWRIRFLDGGMKTGMMSPPWNKILRALPPFIKQDGEKHEKEDYAQFCLHKCWPPFIGLWHYFWLSRLWRKKATCLCNKDEGCFFLAVRREQEQPLSQSPLNRSARLHVLQLQRPAACFVQPRRARVERLPVLLVARAELVGAPPRTAPDRPSAPIPSPEALHTRRCFTPCKRDDPSRRPLVIRARELAGYPRSGVETKILETGVVVALRRPIWILRFIIGRPRPCYSKRGWSRVFLSQTGIENRRPPVAAYRSGLSAGRFGR